jgi:hypothetical protein
VDPTVLETLSKVLSTPPVPTGGIDNLPGNVGSLLPLGGGGDRSPVPFAEELPTEITAPERELPHALPVSVPQPLSPASGTDTARLPTYDPHSPSPFPLPYDFPREPDLEVFPLASPEAPDARNLPAHHAPQPIYPPSVTYEVPASPSLPLPSHAAVERERSASTSLPSAGPQGNETERLLREMVGELRQRPTPATPRSPLPPAGNVVWEQSADFAPPPVSYTPASPSIPWVRR